MNAVTKLALMRAETARMWREPRLRSIAVLAPLLLLIVFASSMHGAARLAKERQQFANAERARWLSQGAKDPHSAAHFGVWAVKPSSPLAALAPGIEPFVGLSVWLEAHKRNEMIFRPQQDADPIMRSASSVAQLIELLGPLFAILLGFAGFAQDRERGTLRLALGNGAAPVSLMAVRFAVMAGVLACMVVVPAAALGAYALASLPGDGWQGGYRLALWSLIQLLYLLMFLLVSLSVSLKAGSARAALTTLLVLWLGLCVVLPRAASDGASYLSPTPSYQAVRAQTEREAPAYESADKWEARGAQYALNPRAARLDQSERDSHRVFDRLLGRFYDSVEQQDQTFAWFGLLTPTVALQAASAGLAGTDFHQHRHFIDAAETYRRNMVNQLNGDLMRHAEHEDAGARTGPAFWESIAPFAYQAPPLGSVLGQLVTPLLLLLAWCGAAGLASWWSVRGVTP